MEEQKSLVEDLVEVKYLMSTTDIKKSGHNGYQNFDYFELSDFMAPLLKLLNEKKILTTFAIRTLDDGNEYAILTAKRGMEAETQVLPTAEPSGSNPIQQAGAKFTYMRRYSYMTFFDICEPDTVDNRDQNEVKKTAVKYATPLQVEKIVANGKLIADELAELKIKTRNDIKALPMDKASELCKLIDGKVKEQG